MLIPIRCFTCGSLIGDKYDEFRRRIDESQDPRNVLDDLGVRRYCCRRMLLSNIDTVDRVLPYYEVLAKKHAEFSAEGL